MAPTKIEEKRKRIILFFVLLLIIFAFDRFTKCLASFSKYCGFICMKYSTNPGAAFSLFSEFSLIMPILIIVSFIVLAATAFFYFKIKKFSLLHISLSLLFTGTFCNLIDRIAFRYVVDFITFGFLPQFPAFNIADVANVAGVIVLIVFLFKKKS